MNAIFDLKDGQVLDIKNNRDYAPVVVLHVNMVP